MIPRYLSLVLDQSRVFKFLLLNAAIYDSLQIYINPRGVKLSVPIGIFICKALISGTLSWPRGDQPHSLFRSLYITRYQTTRSSRVGHRDAVA